MDSLPSLQTIMPTSFTGLSLSFALYYFAMGVLTLLAPAPALGFI